MSKHQRKDATPGVDQSTRAIYDPTDGNQPICPIICPPLPDIQRTVPAPKFDQVTRPVFDPADGKQPIFPIICPPLPEIIGPFVWDHIPSSWGKDWEKDYPVKGLYGTATPVVSTPTPPVLLVENQVQQVSGHDKTRKESIARAETQPMLLDSVEDFTLMSKLSLGTQGKQGVEEPEKFTTQIKKNTVSDQPRKYTLSSWKEKFTRKQSEETEKAPQSSDQMRNITPQMPRDPPKRSNLSRSDKSQNGQRSGVSPQPSSIVMNAEVLEHVVVSNTLTQPQHHRSGWSSINTPAPTSKLEKHSTNVPNHGVKGNGNGGSSISRPKSRVQQDPGLEMEMDICRSSPPISDALLDVKSSPVPSGGTRSKRVVAGAPPEPPAKSKELREPRLHLKSEDFYHVGSAESPKSKPPAKLENKQEKAPPKAASGTLRGEERGSKAPPISTRDSTARVTDNGLKRRVRAPSLEDIKSFYAQPTDDSKHQNKKHAPDLVTSQRHRGTSARDERPQTAPRRPIERNAPPTSERDRESQKSLSRGDIPSVTAVPSEENLHESYTPRRPGPSKATRQTPGLYNTPQGCAPITHSETNEAPEVHTTCEDLLCRAGVTKKCQLCIHNPSDSQINGFSSTTRGIPPKMTLDDGTHQLVDIVNATKASPRVKPENSDIPKDLGDYEALRRSTQANDRGNSESAVPRAVSKYMNKREAGRVMGVKCAPDFGRVRIEKVREDDGKPLAKSACTLSLQIDDTKPSPSKWEAVYATHPLPDNVNQKLLRQLFNIGQTEWSLLDRAIVKKICETGFTGIETDIKSRRSRVGFADAARAWDFRTEAANVQQVITPFCTSIPGAKAWLVWEMVKLIRSSHASKATGQKAILA